MIIEPNDILQGDVINVSKNPRESRNMVVTKSIVVREFGTYVDVLLDDGTADTIVFPPPEIERRIIRLVARKGASG